MLHCARQRSLALPTFTSQLDVQSVQGAKDQVVAKNKAEGKNLCASFRTKIRFVEVFVEVVFARVLKLLCSLPLLDIEEAVHAVC